jgi:signal transduction histidine kinase
MGYGQPMGRWVRLVGALERSFGVEARALAEEQTALRRVATLVARGAPPAEVFEAVSAEVGRVIPADGAGLGRYEADGTVTAVGYWTSARGYVRIGSRLPLESGSAAWVVFETRRPGRISYAGGSGAAAAAARDAAWRSSVGVPVIVDGRLWGVVTAASTTDRPLPLDTEGRLANFTELVATAIANAESREELARLAQEQGALQRVATLVARGAPPAEVFEAVIGEVGRLVGADAAAVSRYATDGVVIVIGIWSRAAGYVADGTRHSVAKGTMARLIFETRRPGRINSLAGASGSLGAFVRELGWRSSVGAPIIVEDHLWGVVGVGSTTDRPLPFDTEARLAKFTELVATAIANAESRAELAASRARLVATADAARRRIERDLHDGAQQRLVSLALKLRAAQAAAPPELGELRAELSGVADGLTGVLDELREIARGIHPAILAEGGLAPALRTLARRSAIPVQLDVRAEARLPERVEVAAHYVVSEGLANAAKYAHASVVHVDVERRDDVLCVSVRDDGLGGADPAHGSGLIGLKDRAEAIGGTILLQSPPGNGTSLQVELPLDHDPEAAGG